MDRHKVAIVIPAFNESKTIKKVVDSVYCFGDIFIVNDGSNDATLAECNKMDVHTISHTFNQGYDAALNTGFKEAIKIGYEIIITFDADGQHDPKMIEIFIKYVNEGYDLVIGNRSHKQRLGEVIFSSYAYMVYGISDPLCGFKAYNAKLYKKLGCFDSYESIGTQLALFSIKNKEKFKEVNMITSERTDSPRFSDFFGGNYKIFRAMFLSMFLLKKI
jgi:glycosyltransferase involved in cell wall biosynthesis|tara:strand:+ start:145 stop:798 length:654 start_codon:yes stop_codon:yes gene_type:complete